jgi:5-methylcytosine-specific restriction endonuclease McrA
MKAVNCMKRRTIPPKIRLSLFLSANGHCQSCQAKIHPGQKWELDHIIPLALGGPDSLENMQILCKICHKFKTASQDSAAIAKTKRINLKHLGAKAASLKSALPCGKNSKWKKKLNGSIIHR